jgi:uncharacterized membrane protein
MRCPACSTENLAGATFCQNCGASLSAAPPPESGYTQVPQAAAGPTPAGYVPAQAGGLSDNAAGAIAYLTFIPAVIFLVLEPYSKRPFVRFHAMQCLGLTVASIALHFAVGLLAYALHGMSLLSGLVSLVFFALWLICIINAAQGKMFKVPVIGDFAQQQANR